MPLIVFFTIYPSQNQSRMLPSQLESMVVARKHRLDISLFERLGTGGAMEKATLTMQQRMRPEIADLTRHLYTPLVTDGPRVLDMPPVPGLAENVYFVTHSEQVCWAEFL